MDDLAKRRRHIVTLVKNIKLQLVIKSRMERVSIGSVFYNMPFFLFFSIITA